MAAGEQAPLVRVSHIDVDAAAAGATTDVCMRAPFAATVTAVKYAPVAAITGAATNNRTISVTNKGKVDGTGSTSVASITYASGTNAVAFKENTVTLSATAGNLVVAEGEILDIKSAPNGSGLADPGGTLFVTFTRL